MAPYIPCHPKQLPITKAVVAARTAVAVNPANAPFAERLGYPIGFVPPTPLEAALMTSRYWGASGVKASVSFLDNPDRATRRLILQHMNLWGTRGNILFQETESLSGNCRIARTPEQGYSSYVGTDNAHIPLGQNTMNLAGFTANTPESEYQRVVCHETGHYLGLIHEHTRAEVVKLIDPAKAEAYFLANDGWSREVTIQQVLTPPDPNDLTFLSGADVRSIMCYELPGSITFSGQPIPGGLVIDEADYLLIAKLYPKAPGPTSPPPPPPGPNPSALFSFTIYRDVPAGYLSIPVKTYMPKGVYDVSHHGAVKEQDEGSSQIAY